jgi:2-polyprenyl-6-methoxyphenol hydroxylase-like FAD-dependent oxidoreductase
LIVGAGIGGLAAALALRRAGLGVRVFEQAADPRELGFALLLAPNAMAALRELGLADAVRAAGVVLVAGEMRRPDGHVLRRLETSEVSRALGEDSVCVLRPALHGVLLEALGRESLELGSRVTGCRLEPTGVTLQRERGADVKGALLIGADGIHSLIRQQLHPAEPTMKRAGLLAFRGVARGAAEQLGDMSGLQYFGRGLEAGVSRATRSDVYWYLSVPAPQPPSQTEDVRSLLDVHLRGFHAPFRALVAATPDADLRLDDLGERTPLRHWGQGLVSLLGDAAHPMLPHAGQGAAQSLEDAVALGQAVRAQPSLEAALRAYERVRIPRTRAVTELARRNARMGSLDNTLACWLRDMVIRWIPQRILLKSLIALGRPPEAAS